MNFRRHVFTIAVAAAVLSPVAAFAETEFHPANGEIGYVQFPSHAKPSNVSRDQVAGEVTMARKEGWFYNAQRYGIFPNKVSAAPKTRDQVINEMRAETPAERKARADLSKGGR